MKQINFETTTFQEGKESTTGQLASGSGVVNLSDWIKLHQRPRPILNKIELVTTTMTQSDLILIDTIATVTYDKLEQIKNNSELTEVKERISRVLYSVEKDLHWNCSVEQQDKKIIPFLKVLADTFQVEMPRAEGLKFYIESIRDIPPLLLQEATVKVLKTHKYNTFPLPATLREAIDTKLDQMLSFYNWCKVSYSRIATIQ
ncbi:hypothetical protein [uncultured Mediterranean phage uvMED]|mgnify:FL=1|jgi:hypothetical protein|nr:hypothetical protein [uncultured Mediterranean phage uvMED]BAR17164.1 hypothetical protein [uncultured Mediterranean phage uvMED]BAR17225.1 hypothetical protein [uncultured Mediterranean phage uvMED]BAR17298.1 hypothetical protein [uncultured Mediterranean phage uvMED]BAR17368.1 hypothetical protein [uncultured Mediterranean phage uvMED]|tara:strand:- start:2788 stop:3393 length:606 start_codon:yes stop_codon:yes gene_type:complete